MDSQKKLSAVFFDIDDTLYSTTSFARKAREESIKAIIRTGLDVSFEECLKELYHVIEEFPDNYEHHFDQLLNRFPADVATQDKDILVAAGVVAYHKAKHRYLAPYEDAIRVIEQLASSPVKLGIITAGLPVKQAEKLVRLGIDVHLEKGSVFISERIGFSKESHRIYQKACDDMGVAPSESIYIGDNPIRDIDPANTIGMITVLHRRGGKHIDAQGSSQPDYIIHNFWDLKEIIERDFFV